MAHGFVLALLTESAHIIRQPSKSFAKSVCALQASCRWAVTGTPIQNRLMDLFSLFKFLQCCPFDDLKTFNIHVAQMWRAKSDPNSVAKLKTLVNCLSLRRPKTIISLPPRTDITLVLDFSEQERDYYQFIKNKTLRTIRSAKDKNDSATLVNALHWVNELRLVCNHGITNQKAIWDLEEITPARLRWTEHEAQTRFDQLDAVGLAKCSNLECGQDLASAISTETDTEHTDEPQIEESLELLCSSCFHGRPGRVGNFHMVCNHLPRRTIKTPENNTPTAFSRQENTQSRKVSIGLDEGGKISSKV